LAASGPGLSQILAQGVPSIQALVDAYQAGGPPIALPPGSYTQVVVISKSLVLSGAGMGSTFLRSDDSGPAITINAGVSVTISNLSLNGSGYLHPSVVNLGQALFQSCAISSNITQSVTAGIDNSWQLNVVNCVLVGNRSNGPTAIANNDGGSVSISDSVFEGNGSWFYAGAFFNVGTASVTRTSFSNNSGLGASALFNLGTFDGSQLVFSGGSQSSAGSFGNSGTAHLSQSLICSNDNSGLYNSGDLVLESTTICFNNADWQPGGIENSGNLALTNVTISSNLGGNGGGLYNYGTAILESCTIVSNQSPVELTGGGIFNDVAGTNWLRNTIVAGNSALPDGGQDLLGTIGSLGYNLLQNTNGAAFTGDTSGNIYGADPLLAALADNGGFAPTHALLVGSPAIDHGSPVNPFWMDQRGKGRPGDGDGDSIAIADIGAFELNGGVAIPPPPPTPIACQIVNMANAIHVQFHGSSTYVVEATEDLSAPQWTPVGSIVALGGDSFEIVDTQGLPVRFYRIRQQ